MIWPRPSSRPVSSWCPVFLSEYWARSSEKSAATCDLLLCLQLPRILYFHPRPHLAFATIESFSWILLIHLCGHGSSSTNVCTIESALPSHLSLAGPVFSWISGCLVAYNLRSLMVSRRIMMLFIEVLPVKKSSILFIFLYPKWKQNLMY